MRYLPYSPAYALPGGSSKDRKRGESGPKSRQNFVTTFYHVQIGAIETQEFRANLVPHWLVCFSDTIKGPIRQMFFAVLLPQWDGCSAKSDGADVVVVRTRLRVV